MKNEKLLALIDHALDLDESEPQPEPEADEDGVLAFHLLAAYDRPWACTRHALRSLIRTEMRGVAARIGKPLDGASQETENRDGTAVINLRGMLFRYRSIWTWLLGGTSVEQLSLDLRSAVDDPSVQRIVLAVNSPGGQIDGIHELANMIREADTTKPVTAYVDGLAASGAYWLASAARRIVADETAQLGSIGVLATVLDDRDAQQKRGVRQYEIVSSQSPLKRTDPATDEGRAQIQQMVDGMAQVFIDKVAQFRGVSPPKVSRDFGKGAVIPARAAITTGMADQLGSLEGVLRETAGGGRKAIGYSAKVQFHPKELEQETEEEKVNDEDCTCPEGTDPKDCDCEEEDAKAVAATVATDRKRIAAILNCEEARGRDELAHVLALETDHDLATAQKILKASPLRAKDSNPLAQHMAHIENPTVGVSASEDKNNNAQAIAASILAFLPENQRMRAASKRN